MRPQISSDLYSGFSAKKLSLLAFTVLTMYAVHTLKLGVIFRAFLGIHSKVS